MRIGSQEVLDMKIESTDILKVYNGINLIWEKLSDITTFTLKSVDFNYFIDDEGLVLYNPTLSDGELLELNRTGSGSTLWTFSESVFVEGVGNTTSTTITNPRIKFLSVGSKTITLTSGEDVISQSFSVGIRRLYFSGVFTTYNDGVTNKTSSAFISTEINGLNRTDFDIATGFTTAVDVSNLIDEGTTMVLVGGFTLFRGSTNRRIARINKDGTRPTTQPANTAITNGTGHAITGSNNDYFVSGSFTTPKNRILRITNNSVNATFSTNIGTALNGTTWPQSNVIIGSIVFFGGDFTQFNGSSANRIIGLNFDGTIATSFNYGTGFNGWTYYFLEHNNLLYVGGLFTEYNGTSTPARFVALNLNGTVANTFPNLTIGNNGVFGIDRLGDKWVLCGTFTAPTNRILMIDNDGNIDTNFNVGTGFNAHVRQVKVFRNKIYCVGDFTDYNGVAVSRAIVLNEDGSVFNTLGTFNNNLRNVLISS